MYKLIFKNNLIYHTIELFKGNQNCEHPHKKNSQQPLASLDDSKIGPGIVYSGWLLHNYYA